MHKSFNTLMTRLCGHEDSVSTGYGKRTRSLNHTEARSTLCIACAERVRSLSTTPQEGFYRVDPVIMRGSASKASWATSIRLKQLRQYGPVMAQLAKLESDPLAKVALKVYEMLFCIPSADFWIDSRNHKFDGYWLVFEVQHLMQRFELIGQKYSAQSCYGYWRSANPHSITDARLALGAVELPAVAQA
ncbi:TPA: hypothetical protein ACGW3M_001078 [Pseudomonas aeruginosa]|uniref:hypothetical protein n=1 Tax=Pseudomonas aeruginosa TaxID=287 RepID=UPI0027EEF677|nr:hypothetical protein [Pseudomonas aeruginosa]EKY4113584.1 hypothetical protein [Pseudomonas aeruginosa]ELJ2276106.1 hypothetical protein [Pseudomonas aeruginosa]MBX6653817.1 hypothetical protein [Pseudomonas aeruginosa]MCS8414904.1 hypothetical protein [Pseudomonas aeruginosa]